MAPRIVLVACVSVVMVVIAAASAPAVDERPALCRALGGAAATGAAPEPPLTPSMAAWRLCRPFGQAATVARFTVEVVDVPEHRLLGFESVVESTLADSRGWGAYGSGVGFLRVRQEGDFRVVLASPESVDAAHEVCSPEYSCRVGDVVWVNARRWDEGVPAFEQTGASLLDYRRMVVNHEVGHWLGFGHEDCPGEGEPAPVMQQQSKGLDGCEPNPWPLPHERERVERERDAPG